MVRYLTSTALTFYNTKLGKIRIPCITFLIDNTIIRASNCVKINQLVHYTENNNVIRYLVAVSRH